MPSSVMLGSRPRIFWMRANSSAVTPCSAAIAGVTLISVVAVAIFRAITRLLEFHISQFPFATFLTKIKIQSVLPERRGIDRSRRKKQRHLSVRRALRIGYESLFL